MWAAEVAHTVSALPCNRGRLSGKEAPWCKPHCLCSVIVPVFARRRWKRWHHPFLPSSDVLRLASTRWDWNQQVDKERWREGRMGGPDGEGWWIASLKREEKRMVGKDNGILIRRTEVRQTYKYQWQVASSWRGVCQLMLNDLLILTF